MWLFFQNVAGKQQISVVEVRVSGEVIVVPDTGLKPK
jgi:hypothetical protein